MNTLKLYRGDFSKVVEFKVKQTNKHSLLGEGIYLTDSTKVANTYRKKDADLKLFSETYRRDEVKFTPFNRVTVLEAAFSDWLGKKYPNEVGTYALFRFKDTEINKRRTALKNQHRRTWESMIESRQIVATYIQKDVVTVEEKPPTTLGYVSVFEFFSEEFEPSIIKVDGDVKDEGLIDFMHSEKMFSSTARQFDTARSLNFDAYASNLNIPTRMYCYVTDKARENMRKYLRQRGFKGMEYSGGILVGGYGIHRAFCVWDDDWVNYHKTNRYK